jgi:endonuclease YncB( thermonuclease family)
VKVWDGDTFRCDIDAWPKLFGYNIPIRVARISCPEKTSKDLHQRTLATKAMLETKHCLMNANLIVLKNVRRGKYFRLVADVEFDGVDLGNHLLSLGLAERYI